MTMTREAKAKVQQAATSTELVKTQSPRERAAHGKFLPLKESRKMATALVRETKTSGRTRDMVVSEKIKARRGAGRTRKG
jgi:hypothetical protein